MKDFSQYISHIEMGVKSLCFPIAPWSADVGKGSYRLLQQLEAKLSRETCRSRLNTLETIVCFFHMKEYTKHRKYQKTTIQNVKLNKF